MTRLAIAMLAVLALAGCASKAAFQPSYLNGTVTVKAGTKLLRGETTVKVRLIDQAHDDVPAVILAEQYQEHPKAFPLEFSLSYDANAIKPGHTYAGQASVYEDGELRLISNEQRMPLPDSAAHPSLEAKALESAQ
jgi:putative lipoprotein